MTTEEEGGDVRLEGKSAWMAWVPGLLLGLLAGCDDGGTNGETDADGGDVRDVEDDVPTTEVAPPAPPGIPWLEAGRPAIEEPAPAALTPCPSGWREATDPGSGTVTCDPWPVTGREECAAVDEEHFPGGTGCERIGTACSPDDDWATDLPSATPTRFVLAGAAAGGDGTRAAPFATIAEALAGAPSGTIVAVGKGSYDEAVVVPSGVRVWGACVAATIIEPSTPADRGAAVSAGAAGAEVRNLRIGGERYGALVDAAGASLLVEDAAIVATVGYGLRAAGGGELTARGVAVRDTRPDPATSWLGHGLSVRPGSRASLERAVLQGNREYAISARGPGTAVELTATAVLDTESDADIGLFGDGLRVYDGAEATVRGSVFERNREYGIAVLDPGTTTLTDVVIRDTRGDEMENVFGRALDVSDGARVEASRLLASGNREVGIGVDGPGSTLVLADSAILDTASQGMDRLYGRGLMVSGGGRLEADRVLVARNRDVGVLAMGAGSSGVLQDVVVRQTQPVERDREAGRGLNVQEGATVEVVRGRFEANHEYGVAAMNPGTSLSLSQATIAGTLSRASRGQFGLGLALLPGATATVSAAVVENNRHVGVFVIGPEATLDAEDLVVRDTQSMDVAYVDGSGGRSGRGLQAMEGANVRLVRAVFERNRDLGLVAFAAGTTVTLEDATVRDMLPVESEVADLNGRYGRAVHVQDGAGLTARRVSFARNREVGVFAMGEGTTVELADVEVIETRSQEGAGRGGGGLSAALGASVRGERVLLRDNRDSGVSAFGVGAEVALVDAEIRGTLERECAASSCAGSGAGIGAGAYGGAHVELTRFRLAENALAGVQLAFGLDEFETPFTVGGTMDLHAGEIVSHPVGANVQTGSYDVGRLSDGVRYRDNERNLDTTELPLPGTVGATEPAADPAG